MTINRAAMVAVSFLILSLIIKFSLQNNTQPGISIFYTDGPQVSSSVIATIQSESLRKKTNVNPPIGLGILLAWPFDTYINLQGKNLPISSSRIKKLATELSKMVDCIYELNE